MEKIKSEHTHKKMFKKIKKILFKVLTRINLLLESFLPLIF